MKAREGLKLDRNVGWDADIIIDAQDSPDKGFELFKCSDTAGFVVLQGIDWPAFKVTVRVAQTKAGLQVVGAGRVDIPKSERAKRIASRSK